MLLWCIHQVGFITLGEKMDRKEEWSLWQKCQKLQRGCKIYKAKYGGQMRQSAQK